MIEFHYFNLVDQQQTVISAGDENAFFPVENIKDYRGTKVYRSNGMSDAVVIDTITTEAANSVIINAHQTIGFGFNAPITIEANATNSWGAPAFSIDITSSDIDYKFGVASVSFDEQNYRFWRIVGAGTSYFELSKVFIGMKKIIGDERSIDFGWSYRNNDISTVVKNRYGQRFVDKINCQKQFSFNFSLLSKDDFDDLMEIYDYARLSKPFYLSIGCQSMVNNPNRFRGRVFFTDIPTVINTSFSRYQVPISVEEAT